MFDRKTTRATLRLYRNHRQLTPGHPLGRGFLFALFTLGQRQDGKRSGDAVQAVG